MELDIDLYGSGHTTADEREDFPADQSASRPFQCLRLRANQRRPTDNRREHHQQKNQARFKKTKSSSEHAFLFSFIYIFSS